MSNKHFKDQHAATTESEEEVVNENKTNLQGEEENKSEETVESANMSDDLSELQKKYDELNDAHLRLRAEFDNYRKRTLREKSELIKNGGEGALTHLFTLSYLGSQGVKAIEVIGKPFDLENSEAIATIPAPQPDLKGKVLDCVQTGYMMNEKVIRHAKVVVGE